MFELIAFWIFVTLTTILLLILPYYVIARGIAKYFGYVHFKVRGDVSDSISFRNTVAKYLFKPWTWVNTRFIDTNRENFDDDEYIVPAMFSGFANVVAFFWMVVVIESLNARTPFDYYGGIGPALVYEVSHISAFLAHGLKYPIVAATLFVVSNGFIIKTAKGFDIVKRKIDRLENHNV